MGDLRSGLDAAGVLGLRQVRVEQHVPGDGLVLTGTCGHDAPFNLVPGPSLRTGHGAERNIAPRAVVLGA